MKHYLRFSLTLLLLVLMGGVGFAQDEVAYKTLTFPAESQDKNNNYTGTWTAKIGDDVWNIAKFNNNNNDWKYIKCGSKKAASIATISNNNAYEEALTKVVVTIDKITVASVNSIQLDVAPDKDFKKISETVKAETLQTGDLTFAIESPITNSYYKLSFDCKKGSDNGFIQVSKVVYYYKTSNKQNAGLSFTTESYTAELGKAFTAPTLSNPNNLTVKYTSSDTDVATIDETTGEIAVLAAGTTTITATSEETDTYKAGSASYTLKVKDPNVISFDFSTMGYTNGQEVNDVEVDGVSIKLVKGASSTNPPKYYTSDNTLRLYKDGTMTISAPEGKVITKLKISGGTLTNMKPTVGTYNNGSWEGNSKEIVFNATNTVKMETIDVTLANGTSFDYTWNDTEDHVILNENNKTVKINRTVVKDEYNTICLPFDMTAEEIAAAFGEGTMVYEFAIAEENTLSFEDVDRIYCGSPYLLKPTETKNEIVYTGTIYGEDLLRPATYGEYKFIGTYNPATLKTDGTNLFFIAGGKLAKPESDENNANKLKGFRAYMEVPAGSEQAPKVCIDGIITSINDIKTDMTIADGKVYNINGQYVGSSMQNLAKGVYVQNGKKYVVK